MGRAIFIFLLLIITFSCSKDNKSSTEPDNPTQQNPDNTDGDNSGGNNDNIIPQGLIEVTLNVTLPESSAVSEEDLLVSSLFDDGQIVVNGESKIEVLEGNVYELSFAEDSSGNIVLLNYFDSSNTTNTELNANTTAVSLLMLQPWVADLTPIAKAELITLIKTMPEFAALENAIENSLKSDANLLQNTSVIGSLNVLVEKLFADLESKKESKYDEQIDPLSLSAENSTITVVNSSSMAYGVKINNGSTKTLDGVDKRLFTIASGLLYSAATGNEAVELPKVSESNLDDGFYEINAGNGLSFQGSSAGEAVKSRNVAKLTLNILGTISGIGELISEEDDCYQALGGYVINISGEVLSSASTSELVTGLIDVLRVNSEGTINVLKNCAGELISIKSLNVQKLLTFFNRLNIAVGAFDTGVLVKDWVLNESEIEFCTDKINGVFQKCKPFRVTGELSYGKIPLGIGVQSILTLQNRSTEDISITNINFPNQSFSVSPNLSNLEIKSGESIEVEVRYNPTVLAEQLTGNLSIETSLPTEGTFQFPVSGEVINPLEFESELVFGNTVLNTAESKSLTISNVSDYSVDLYASETPAEGFSYSWSDLSIPSMGDVTLDFTFNPVSSKIYDTSIVLNNESTQENTNIELIGTGIGSVLDLFIEGDSYDFGQVEVNTTTTKVLSITNRSTEPVIITEIGDTNVFEVDRSNFTIQPEATEQVVITFYPTEDITYNETIPIITDAVQNLVISLSGDGTANADILSGTPEYCPLDYANPDRVSCVGNSEYYVIDNGYRTNSCYRYWLFTEDGKVIMNNPNFTTTESGYTKNGNSLQFNLTYTISNTYENYNTFSSYTYRFTGELDGNGSFNGIMTHTVYYEIDWITGVLADTLQNCSGTSTWPASVQF
ncbi:choice-of-anchor D domain-containing protein [Flagellimonas aequoris]|nr:choice-of-anchor D domain-containing protein [Allomuricauda aequoris]TXK00461.1 choice-of-anchor D domain-containing protein [Allomuricauda aequoris]